MPELLSEQRRQRSERLAREARYGAWEPAIRAIEASIAEAERLGALSVMDEWLCAVNDRIAAGELSVEITICEGDGEVPDVP